MAAPNLAPSPWFVDSNDLKEMLFPEAAEVWLATKAPYIAAKTFHEYELNIHTLSRFFSGTKLKDISADQIRAFQLERSSKCRPFTINHETGVLQQMLKRVGLWAFIESKYEPLPLPKELVGRVLTTEERTKLFEVAQSDPNLEAAFLFAMISVNTSAGPKETATLRLKDIDLDARVVSIQGTKNLHRIRSIPLNHEAWRAAKLAVARAKRLGAGDPGHYVFPFQINRALYDPARHQTTFKTAWKKIVAKAGIDGRLRMYDLRHTAVTVLLEDPRVSEETVEAIAGHVNRRMIKVYSHVRMANRRQAVSALDGSPSPDLSEVPRLKPEDALTNQAVVDMLATDGLPARVVVEMIKKAHKNCIFQTSRAALKQLRAAGVPDAVVVAMVRAS